MAKYTRDPTQYDFVPYDGTIADFRIGVTALGVFAYPPDVVESAVAPGFALITGATYGQGIVAIYVPEDGYFVSDGSELLGVADTTGYTAV